ncbi:MAG: hypothetical protein MUD08_15905, partial [Cytophagales bacterium]|nr:hypothetical protein [Cytophagales bacterium]
MILDLLRQRTIRTCCLLLLSGFSDSAVFAQNGCPDPQATNHNSAANANDGSCTYANTVLAVPRKVVLPSVLDETSGLVVVNGQLWTHNDSGGEPAIYRIDTLTGQVLQTVTFANATNVDWEAVGADETHLYVGDFGNNVSGNRRDLTVYRIRKADIGTGPSVSVAAESIRFAYADQTDFTATPANQTSFDCEAMLVRNGRVHLFSKDWVNGRVRHYSVPATPGTHTATFEEEFAANGLVTDATLSETGAVMLVGYTRIGQVFAWLLFDYAGDKFFSGNKRRLELGSAVEKGQVEGIAFRRFFEGYVSCERFQGVAPSLYTFSVANLVYYNPTSAQTSEPTGISVRLFPNPTGGLPMTVRVGGVAAGESLELRLADAAGRQVFRRKLTPNTTDV